MCRKMLITLGILCVLSSARAKADDVGYAYCPLGEGYVFLYDSLTSFQVIADLKCGAKVTVVDPRDDNRARVRTADGKEGYVQKSSLVAALPGSQPQPAAPAAAGSPGRSGCQQSAATRRSTSTTKAGTKASTGATSASRGGSTATARSAGAVRGASAHAGTSATPPPAKLPPPAAVAFTPFPLWVMNRICRAWRLSADIHS